MKRKAEQPTLAAFGFTKKVNGEKIQVQLPLALISIEKIALYPCEYCEKKFKKTMWSDHSYEMPLV